MLKRHLALTLTTTALLLGAAPFSAVLAEDGTPPVPSAGAPDIPPPNDFRGPVMTDEKAPLKAENKGPGKAGQMFEQADADKDGVLTRDEMLNAHKKRVGEIFDKLDTDKSNTVTKEEVAAGREKIRDMMRQQMKERKGKGGGAGGGGKPNVEDGGMSFDNGDKPE